MTAKPLHWYGTESRPAFSDGTDALAPAEQVLFASAARTTLQATADQTNLGYKGVIVVIDATAKTATPSVTFTLEGKDLASGKYYTILASAAVTDVGTTVLRAYPGAAASANASTNDRLPKTWRVSVAVADADSLTYSVGAILLP